MAGLFLILSCAVSQAGTPARFFSDDRSFRALEHPRDNLTDPQQDQFALGRSLFSKPWVEAPAATSARDGLGPLFNANSCVSCHRRNGGGHAIESRGKLDRSLVIRMSQDPVYGHQLAINGIHGVAFEGRASAEIEMSQFKYPDGAVVLLRRPQFRAESLNYGPMHASTRLGARRAPALIGLGLIEQIPSAQILQIADPKDINQDGISGRPRWLQSRQFHQPQIGRFGWKGSQPNVVEQTAQALIDDMGLTSPWFVDESCSLSQLKCREAYSSSQLDVTKPRLQAMAYYLQQLKVPRSTGFKLGAEMFQKVGCDQCHRNDYELNNGLRIEPFSDFLLHDMGPALSAGEQLGDMQLGNRQLSNGAGASEWRTAPLWGIGLAKRLSSNAGFLHDGRASTLEQAILWHGGEARRSRNGFANLPYSSRLQLIKFLESL